MFVEITDFKDNEIELKIREEDISILYVIQHELLKEKSIDFAGVIQKHPLTQDYQLRMATKRKDPMEVMQDASTSAQEYSKELLSIIKSASQKVERGSRHLRFCPKCETRLRPVSGRRGGNGVPKMRL